MSNHCTYNDIGLSSVLPDESLDCTDSFYVEDVLSESHSLVTNNIVSIPDNGDGDDDVFSLHTVEDERLKAAVCQAQNTGEVTPLLKQEIRYLIQARRLSEGKTEDVEEENKDFTLNQMTDEDHSRRNRRKHQNRLAAQKYRQRKRNEKDILRLQILLLEVENSELQRNVDCLRTELSSLKQFVTANIPYLSDSQVFSWTQTN